jgi:hypothetical protein
MNSNKDFLSIQFNPKEQGALLQHLLTKYLVKSATIWIDPSYIKDVSNFRQELDKDKIFNDFSSGGDTQDDNESLSEEDE